MPYSGQKATGESLISLEQSKLFQEFTGSVQTIKQKEIPALEPTSIPIVKQKTKRILAIDGSIVSQKIKNGFPGAEASLIQIALVSINLDKLDAHSHNDIIPPSAFNQMDTAETLQCVLPGCNVAKSDGCSPKDFFRETVYEALQGSVEKGHETLLETYRALVSERDNSFRCPDSGCEERLSSATGSWRCPCSKKIFLYETDPLRFHERFSEVGANGEPHGEVMRFLEAILLLNVLRFFSLTDSRIQLLNRIAFVVDGSLAAFGQFAAIVPYIRKELRRINQLCFKATGKNLMLFSLIKSGQFFEHFEQLDFDVENGPGLNYPPCTALLPDIPYVHQCIVCRPIDAKPWGVYTYYGRIVLYKSRSGQRMVLNTPIVNQASENLSNVDISAYPRLPEITEIVDRLSTYLFDSGFMPIVRAHSHAAIPLKMGGEIIKSLFQK